MEMDMGKRVAVMGSGSWATALVKLLTNNLDEVHWWVRKEEHIKHIQAFRHNPSYLQQMLGLVQIPHRHQCSLSAQKLQDPCG